MEVKPESLIFINEVMKVYLAWQLSINRSNMKLRYLYFINFMFSFFVCTCHKLFMLFMTKVFTFFFMNHFSIFSDMCK